MIRPLLFLTTTCALGCAGEPVRQAAEARLWLKVPAKQAPLGDVEVSTGTASRAPWEPDPALRERQIDVVFPICWWKWTNVSITFTPAADGPVELMLSGPWAKASDGQLIRQEILWDDVSANGAELLNGGFEMLESGRPAHWQAPWAPYLTTSAWPLAGAAAHSGKQLAATWHNRPLSQTLVTTAGRKVRLTLHAKAATPPDFIEPKRLGPATPAHRAMASLKRGVNLGNGWEVKPGSSWAVRFTPADVDHIADEGFDHIRVPVAWHFHLTDRKPQPTISPALLAELEPVLQRAMARKLAVLLDWHHFDDLTAAPEVHTARFIGGWQAIARHFHGWPPGLMFELLNEPTGALTTGVANPIYHQAIAAVRQYDPQRIIIVSPGQWGQVGELEQLRLPDGDDRLAVTIHCYEPFPFTHQGANWVGYQDLRGIVYPGPPASPYQLPASLRDNAGLQAFVQNYNTLPADRNPCSARRVRETLDAARAWSDTFGRPIHLGEFGCHDIGDAVSRARYLHDVRVLAESRHIPWTLWEWKAGFGYWDPTTGRPRFRVALFQ